jgi:uncharacterized protein (DUF697 family)
LVLPSTDIVGEDRCASLGGVTVGIVLFVLLIALIFGGLGFAIHALWVVAVVFALAWVAGFAFRSGSGSRWYRW